MFLQDERSELLFKRVLYISGAINSQLKSHKLFLTHSWNETKYNYSYVVNILSLEDQSYKILVYLSKSIWLLIYVLEKLM